MITREKNITSTWRTQIFWGGSNSGANLEGHGVFRCLGGNGEGH